MLKLQATLVLLSGASFAASVQVRSLALQVTPSPQCHIRRSASVSMVSAQQLATSALSDTYAPSSAAGRGYGPLLQGPFQFGVVQGSPRATVRRELVPDRIWSFEQVQGVIYVHVPVRMTVVKLDAGGLFVYAPVAPTAECLRLLAEIEAVHGPVAHILLPTTAIEHKSFAGAFSAARPGATTWVADGQYSFPLDLPLPLQGLAGARRLPPDDQSATVPWAEQLPYRTLGPLREKVGCFQEVVVLDRPTRSLLVTDLLVSVPASPPDILPANDIRALLYHSRDGPAETVEDTPRARQVGWQKICLFALYFQSSPLIVTAEPDGTLSGALTFLKTAFPREVPKEARELGWLGFLAWSWDTAAWPRAFERLSRNGRPVIPPILAEIVLARDPDEVATFAETVASELDFTTIIPAHFDAPVAAGPKQWRDAFAALRPTQTGGLDGILSALGGGSAACKLPVADTAFLREFERTLIEAGTVRPRPR